MRLVVARVGRAHGIRGEVTVELRSDVPDQRFFPGAVLHVVPPAVGRPAGTVAGTGGPAGGWPDRLTLTAVRDHNGTLLLGFHEVDDRDAAEALRGALLEAEVLDGPTEDDAWYDHQLIGLRVVDPAGTTLGEVVAVDHRPAQDLLIVRRPDGAERLVPFVTAIVPTVDLGAGVLIVDAPPGLLDDTLGP